MRKFTLTLSVLFWAIMSLTLQLNSVAQITAVGSGSYTTVHPGVDEAGRNGQPAGSPQLSEAAINKPVPTNDWWSTLIQSDHANNLFNYPLAMKTTNEGLVVTYIPWGVLDDVSPILVGVQNLEATKTTIADHSDWTVTMDWNDGTQHFQATSGIGMPFVYFNKLDADVASVTISQGTVTVSNEIIMVENARNGASFVIYGPTGSTWEQNGEVYTSTLNGKNYWSLAKLPLTTTNITEEASNLQKYAYVFPTNTTADWTYDEAASKLTTVYNVEVDVKEGTDENVLMGLLPHQWANLSSGSPQPIDLSYSSVRGELKMLDGNTFTTESTFYGVLPTLPYVNNYSDGFDISALNQKVEALQNESLATWTDSYNEGQVMNRLIQTARIADQTGNIEARDKMLATVQERLEDWLTAELGEVAFLFYYNTSWSAMIGYPAGHGQDSNLNDHHFHWGYFIHAAAFMEQYQPGWAAKYGDMVNLLVRDAASSNRNDDTFPYLRNFSPYAGHCWANGFASFPQGNDQESTSESMQFNTSLIHWGEVTGNKEIRDLGIYLYTTEQAAVEEYWFDMDERNFKADQPYSLVSRVWGNSYDNGTFWTADIAASYNIELYPIHGGSLYLGHNKAYVDKLWAEMTQNTQVLDKVDNPNLWYDVMWKYLSFSDPARAIELYNDHPDRTMKFGVSDAHTYHWLHAMNALGQLDMTKTADSPMAVAFNNNGDITYVAQNYSAVEKTVTFSDGYKLVVPAGELVTNKDVDFSGTIESSFALAAVNGAVDLTVVVSGVTPTKVEIYKGSELIGSPATAPYTVKATGLTAGMHQFYAKIYDGENFTVTNIATVTAGFQVPFGGTAVSLPGVIEAGHFDEFQGGNGQGITYHDQDPGNNGNYRKDEGVDNVLENGEGATVGWTAGGEWLEYTVEVSESGVYTLTYRYASGNGAGGGPFHLSLNGEKITTDISVAGTGGWSNWVDGTESNIELLKGTHIIRVAFDGGEFNLGKMSFEKTADLAYDLPSANAGDDFVVDLSGSTPSLDGSASSDPGNASLTYLWEQVYGPSVLVFSDDKIAAPQLSSMVAGEYLIKLTVSNGSYSNSDLVKVFASENGILAPNVTLLSPKDGSEFFTGATVPLTADASDLDGTVQKVEFFVNSNSVAVLTDAPYTFNWSTDAIDTYSISVSATDNEGNVTSTDPVSITTKAPPSCSGTSENGHYDYVISDDKNNPTITFVPNQVGMGSTVCILFLNVNGGGLAGYNVKPNEPYQVNAAEGTPIQFYYTYSHPEGGERNTLENPHDYVIGTCISAPIDETLPMVSVTSPNEGDSFKEGTAIKITADASDSDGTVTSVAFYANDQLIGTDTEAPYEQDYTVALNQNYIKAVATDNDGKTTISDVVTIKGKSGDVCNEGAVANGHFSYEISGASENPTVTFVPIVEGVGNTVLIFYYSVDGGGIGGHNAKPNEPFQVNAAAGSTVEFYYTYNHPEGGERNTADDRQTFVVGDCDATAPTDPIVKLNGVDNSPKFVLGASIELGAEVANVTKTITKVEYFAGETVLGSSTTAPYTYTWTSDVSGELKLKAVATFDDQSTLMSTEKTVFVGKILPFEDTPYELPGIVEAGNFDKFEFGSGQGITYFELSNINQGGTRTEELVDVVAEGAEGNTVGWVQGGEWLTYTVNVKESGTYKCEFRYASGNNESRGPFFFELDGQKISADIAVDATAGWGDWATATVTDLQLTEGKHVLKVNFVGGDFNLGKMNFIMEPKNIAPVVSVATSDGQLAYNLGSTITLNATATDEDGTVAKVEFFAGTQSLGTATEAPFTLEWTPELADTYSVTAVATDDQDASTTSMAIEVAVNAVIINQPPTVTVSTSDAQTEYTVGTTVTLTADATDADGTVSKVEFFVGTESLGEVTTAPFTMEWTPDVADSYSITAVATDDGSARTTSEAVMITINTAGENDAPTITIATSDNAVSYTLGTTVVINADATDTDGTITSVEFFEGTTSLGVVTEAPFTVNWVPEVADVYSITAVAIDDATARTTSEALEITIETVDENEAPTVTVSTSDEQSAYNLGSTVSLVADALDSDGTISSVEFFEGTTSLGIVTQAPFTLEWAPEAADVYSITAVAIDDASARTTSEALEITINPVIENKPPVVTVSTSDQATEYVIGTTVTLNATASDADGTIESVEFFAGETSLGKLTEAPYTVEWKAEVDGEYSITAVAIDNASARTTSEVVTLTITPLPNVEPTVVVATSDNATEYDLGTTVNLVATASDSDGTVESVEFFAGTTSLGKVTASPFTLDWTPNTVDTYSITAVAMDNDGASTTSTAISVKINALPNVAPTIVVSTSDNLVEYEINTTVTLTADASDIDGSVAQVEFFEGTTSLGVVTEAPYTLDWRPVSLGEYTITAVATDDEDASTTSEAMTVTITEGDVTSIEDELVSILYYPNPAKDYVNLELLENTQNVKLYDLNGRLLIDKSIQQRVYKLDLGQLKSGVYFIEVEGTQAYKKLKIIKQ
ncbi:Ig-like domain-containing protein [Flammeovirga aprica]|uniref:glucan endo-1,3-beta-D-glucosidase n=1 Tax=Flammeovirga aprica JL-4 TaxID=694437 RepID=A0A7X9RSB4_9BACT|nr:Ig-like domain-containing protein [Flammeovirga aprica]NME68763.1 carbohydrate-binding protein [Flammeovirga aprica JL-4]